MEHPSDQLVPPTERILGWISTVVERGVRRPGSAVDDWATNWCVERFRELGLQDVHLEPVPLPRWDPRSWSLHMDGEDFACFPLPHSAPGVVEAPVVRMGEGDVRGAIALDIVTLTQLPQTFMRERALAHHDPDGEFDTHVQTLPFGPQLQGVMEPAIEAGAAGWIGVFDAPWETCDYYVPYDAVERPIPGVWVSKRVGERIAEGTARIAVDSTRETVTTDNVIGTLPGRGDEWVIIASHHDGPWVSAVEDASGIGLVLAQAAYWSQVPADDRPHNLLFLITSGHMCHGAGTAAFIEAHRDDLLPKTVLEVHLEHTARECAGVDGALVPSDDPEVRWWFTSRIPHLVDDVMDALRAEDLGRSLVVPPDVFGPSPTTDGGFFHLEGVPLVNFLTAPMYLFDSQDTMDKIHEASLVPVTRAAIRIVASTARRTAHKMRASVQA
jgi:hypothetical protein